MENTINTLFKNLSTAYQMQNMEVINSLHHPENQTFASSKDQLKTILLAYKLETEYSDIEILQQDNDVAVLRLLQITKKIDGPEFKDNVMDMVLVLKTDNQQYKILSAAPIMTSFI